MMDLAKIEDGAIVIRVPIDALVTASAHAFELEYGEKHGLTIADPQAFAKEVCRELNQEEEDGTTPVHRMLDAVMIEAVEQGCEGIGD